MANGPYGVDPGGMVPQQPPNPYAPPGGPGGPPFPGRASMEAPGAKNALILGIFAFFCCGIVLGPLAIMNANKARSAIAMDPSLTGGGMATAGLVLGIISLVLNVVGIIARVAMHR